MSNASLNDSAVTANQNYVYADVAMHEVLLELARNYKGLDPKIDKKIDAMAAYIANDERYTYIAPHNKGAPKVPLYLEGEPGQGKSSLIEAAVLKFCEICGLNFIEEPDESYVIKPNDFYYAKVNLSGAQNKSDFGGMMIRTETEIQQFLKSRRKASSIGMFVLDELTSRSKGIAEFASTIGAKITMEASNFEQGDLDAVEISLNCSDSSVLKAIAENIISQISDESKKKGIGLSRVLQDSDPEDSKISYSLDLSTNGSAKISMFAPKVLESKAEYASAVLPSIRFSKFKKARFGLVNFDDVANANENIRNILLEVLQKGRYTGTMDIGNAYVTMSGNMGAEDGTNVMSRMSDAELTRIRKLSVRDRPEDWAKRVMSKYTSEVGDCHMASFVHRCGNQDGIFRETPGQRGKRGERKTNGRALENALEVITQHFMAAKHANINVSQFRDRIKRDIKDCAGSRVADAFDGYLHSMVTEAIPLADNLIQNGKWNSDTFDKHSCAARTPTGNDFCFRFGAAIADSIVNFVAFDNAKGKTNKDIMSNLELAMERACTGFAALGDIDQSSVMNYSLSTLSQRLMNLPQFSIEDSIGRKLSTDVNTALGRGFASALNSKVWADEKSAEEAQNNYVKSLTGSNILGIRPANKPKR